MQNEDISYNHLKNNFRASIFDSQTSKDVQKISNYMAKRDPELIPMKYLLENL